MDQIDDYYPEREEKIDNVYIGDKRADIIAENIAVGDKIPYYGVVSEKNDKYIVFEDALNKKTKIKKNSTNWNAIFKELSGLLGMSASLSEKQYGDIVKIARRSDEIHINEIGTVTIVDKDYLYSTDNMNTDRFKVGEYD